MTGTWLTTADHKRLGRMYVVAALAFGLVAAGAGVLANAQLDVVPSLFLRFHELHSTGLAVLVLGPLWVGLATYLVPLQIGAARLAFPRLQAFTFWTYVFGGIVHLASYTGEGPRIGGISFSRLILNGGGDKAHTDLWIATLIVLAVATVLANANLLATVLLARTEGMTLRRIPMFSWATLVSSAGTVLATPVFIAGLVLLFLDQHYGGREFFAGGTVGTQVVWQHTLWLFGRPDIYLLVVPGLGAASDIVASAAGRPLANTDAGRAMIAAAGFLGFTAWAAGTKVAGAVVVPTYSPITAAVVLPVGALILLWLDTLRRAGRPKADPGLLFVAAFAVSVAGAVAAAVAAAAKSVPGTAWAGGEVQLAFFGASLLLGVGALHHWSAKLFGRTLGQGAAGFHALLLFGGSAVAAIGAYAAGWKGALAAVNTQDSTSVQIAGLGVALLALGLLTVLASVASRAARPATATADADADGGLTLEWATTSPPPPYNFDTIPEVRSDVPLADLRAAEASA
jgi:heme/copper-type cytochrome/quinol oxidase subunit 1